MILYRFYYVPFIDFANITYLNDDYKYNEQCFWTMKRIQDTLILFIKDQCRKA
jgi:hypothetical protein